jgi:hypothetical protein
MSAGRRRAALSVAPATLVILLPAPASAASEVAIGTTLLSFTVALAVALAGLLMLSSGVSRLAGGTLTRKLGMLGALARLGRPTDSDVSDAKIRRATTAILLGTALLGVPDYFGMGVLSQTRLLYEQAQTSIRPPSGPTAVTIKERTSTYTDGSGGGSSGTGKWLGIPWWALSIVGLILLTTLLARLAAVDTKGTSSSPGARTPPLDSPELPHASLDAFGVSAGGGSSPTGASSGAAIRQKSLFERILDAMERIKMVLKKLMSGLKTKAKILEERTEGLRGRLRPVTDFAAAQIEQAVKIVADAGDREGSLAAAHAQMFAERIGAIQQLHGADLEGLLARAFDSTPKRIKSDMFRLGATGAPPKWLKVMSAGPGRGWVLAEAGSDPLIHRFDAAIAFEDVDWYGTLAAIESRPITIPFIIVPSEARAVHLVKVRDPVASDFVTALGEMPEEYVEAVWCFVDLPSQTARHIFSATRRDRWSIAPDAPGDDTLVVKIDRGPLSIVSGQDELAGYLVAEDARPLRLLAAVMPGGALANLGASIEDITPFETTMA